MTRNYNILITNGIQLTYQIDDILNTVIIIIDSTVVFVDILIVVYCCWSLRVI